MTPTTDAVTGPGRTERRQRANAEAVRRIVASEPVLVDVRPAGEVLPGMTPRTILTSGAPLDWASYEGGQRTAIIGAVLFEGLAATPEEADARLASGDIRVEPCHDHGAVGSVSGVCSASMPVLVVEDRANGTTGHCRMNEGIARESLTFGVSNDAVLKQMAYVRDVIAPTLAEAVRSVGGIPLQPIIRRALNMGDDLHSRNIAASLIFRARIQEALLAARDLVDDRRALDLSVFLTESEYFFLHLSMAAGKAAADAASGIAGSSVVTAMTVSGKEFALRLSGTGDRWFRHPLPPITSLPIKLFDGFTPDDLAFMGGESTITETIGLGGMAAAAAMPMQDYSAGSPEGMVEQTHRMYRITLAEHPVYRIPFLRFRGTPTGIDARLVADTGIPPVIHMGASHRDGGHIGAGLFLPPLAPFQAALDALDTLDTGPADTPDPYAPHATPEDHA
ncbi:DUF1116 domain-containing protein [Streptomyces sp. NPDC101160]|uniref:DUF1116 domain-containing protein n=1 Tax=Streptomyces sp. NPDC101160 TaxID=3366118 RepID=UPI00382758EF